MMLPVRISPPLILQTCFVFLREDGRMEFSYSSTDDGDGTRGQVRLRKVGETAVA